MTGPVTLRTARLILRPPIEADLDGWHALFADEETARYIGGIRSRSMSWRTLATMAGAWSLRGYGMFSVIEQATGACIGRVGPWFPEGWPGQEIGWGLVRPAQRKGFALEAAVASIDFAFDTLGWDDVIHLIDPENLPSIRLAERLGSTCRGPVARPDPFADERVDAWGQTRAEWNRNRSA